MDADLLPTDLTLFIWIIYIYINMYIHYIIYYYIYIYTMYVGVPLMLQYLAIPEE